MEGKYVGVGGITCEMSFWERGKKDGETKKIICNAAEQFSHDLEI